MIKVTLTNKMITYITEIEKNRYLVSQKELTPLTANKLRKNSKKKSSYSSTKIEGNPLSEQQARDAIDDDTHRHYLKPEEEVRNYFLALNFLEKKLEKKAKVTKKLILDVQKIVEKGASKEKIGLRGPTPPGVLFAVYDSISGRPDYIPPEYCDLPDLIEELCTYINTTDDHPLIVAAIAHYQLVTIHPFEDGNGRTARLISGYILDLNGFGFNGIGSLEEYFAYDIDQYYESLQMNLPALYYMGRDNPPHPEIWIEYFLEMVLLYSRKVCQLSNELSLEDLRNQLSFLNEKEKELLYTIITHHLKNFKPVNLSKLYSVTNRTIINRLTKLVKNGFVIPHIVKTRICTYDLSEYTIEHQEDFIKLFQSEKNH